MCHEKRNSTINSQGTNITDLRCLILLNQNYYGKISCIPNISCIDTRGCCGFMPGLIWYYQTIRWGILVVVTHTIQVVFIFIWVGLHSTDIILSVQFEVWLTHIVPITMCRITNYGIRLKIMPITKYHLIFRINFTGEVLWISIIKTNLRLRVFYSIIFLVKIFIS